MIGTISDPQLPPNPQIGWMKNTVENYFQVSDKWMVITDDNCQRTTYMCSKVPNEANNNLPAFHKVFKSAARAEFEDNKRERRVA